MIGGGISDLDALGATSELLLPQLRRLRVGKELTQHNERTTIRQLHALFRDRISSRAGPVELCLEGVIEPGDDDEDAVALRALVPNVRWLQS